MITTMSPHAEQPPRQRLKSLVQQIVHDKKGVNKEQKITACDELQKFLLSLDTAANLEYNWRDLCSELTSLLGTRINADTKRAVAECVGALGFLLASHYDQFVKFIMDAVKRSSEKYPEEKTMILRALAASLNFIGVCAVQSRIAPPHIEEVMAAVKKQLDTNDSPTVLIPLLDICLAVAQYFPAVFKKSFDDVVDFTVGWYVEPDQPKSVVDKCNQILTDLRPFWFDALPTAVTLMKQFVDDANAYLEELGTDKETKIEDALRKTAAILRALVTVLNVVNVPQAHPIVVPFVEKLFGQIACQSALLKRIIAPEVGDVFASMADVLWCSLQVVPKVEWLNAAVKSVRIMIAHPAVGYGTVIKLIEFYEKVFDNMSHEMTASVVEMVIGPEGAVHGLIYGSKEVLHAVIDLYGKLLTPKALPTLQAAYHCVRTELSEALAELECNIANSFNHRKAAKTRTFVALNALATLASVKNSLIAMMGLSPSLFAMLMCETPITEKWFIVNYPGCHYALIYVVKMHSEKHDNFIANSGWLNERNRLPMLSEYPTANHFAKILDTLAKLLLIDDEMSSDTRNLVVDWVHGIAFGMSADVLQEVLDRSEMLEMRRALLESFLRHSLPRKVTADGAQKSGALVAVGADSSRASGARVRYFTLLRRLAVFNLIIDGDSRVLADFVTRVFQRSRNCEQEKVIGFWQAIPPAIFISNGVTLMAHQRMEFTQAKIPESLFTTEHFSLIVDFLLNSTIPTYCASGIDNGNWMEDTIATIYTSSMGDESTNLDYISKWRWALAQVAQYCIDNRLRTPLGKPADTFLKLENEIRRLALNSLTRKPSGANGDSAANIKAEVLEKDEPTPKCLTVTRSRRGVAREDDEDSEADTNREPRQLSSAEQWWRVRALLETIELLDKLMSFACDGALFPLCILSQTSQQFFVTNEATCSGWMSRMYLMTMAVAYGNGHYEHVLRLGAGALRDAKKRIASAGHVSAVGDGQATDVKDLHPEVMDAAAHTCISWMVRSLVEMGRAQPIMGIYSWVKKVYRLRFQWIKYAADMAAGRIEAALDGLVNCANDAKQPENVRKTIRQLIITALSRIRNPEEMIRVWRALDGSHNSEEKLSATPKGFDDFVWSKLKGLVNFDPPGEVEKSEAVVWDVESRLRASELKLMQIARSFKKDSRNDIAELTKQLGEDARLLMLADTSLRTHTSASALHLLATAVKDSLKPTHKQMLSVNIIDPSFLFELDSGPCVDKLAIGQQLSSWFENCSNVNGISSLGVVSDERAFHLKMCRLARKTGNLRLADRQLRFHTAQRQAQSNGLMQNGWLPRTNKESNMAMANEVNNWDMLGAQEVISGMTLSSALETAKLLWAQCGSDPNGTLSHAEPFALLCDATADEVDRILYKNNAIFNGAPSVPPNALLPLLSHHYGKNTANVDSTVLTLGISSKRQNVKQLQEDGEILAKATLRLAAWLSRDASLMNVASLRCQRIAWHMFAAEQSTLPAISNSGATGGMTGALLSTACKLAPHLSKAHERLAEWAYKSACASGDDASGGMLLTAEEKDAIKWQLRNSCSGLDDIAVESIFNAVANAHHFNSLRDDVRIALGDEYPPTLCDQLFGAGSAIVHVWTTARNRMMAYYACAVRSYFTYIAECGSMQSEHHNGTIGTVVATLRIVRLLVRHSDSLHALIDAEMRRTNEFLWKDILPQLFARLNHPVAAVRDTLCALLERVAALAPHAVCFPAIVGATQLIVMHSADSDDEDSECEGKDDEIEGDLLDDEKKRRVEQDRSLMYECCRRVVGRLENLYPELVADVSDFVKELQRINMLSEERWTFVLSNLDHEMSRRIAQIEAEKAKTLANDYLTDEEKEIIVKEKTRILYAMVFRILEDLYDRTCVRDVHTVNERQFRDTYKNQIATALDVYKWNKLDPRKAWQPFKQLLIHLTQRCNKRSLQTLQTAEVSPRLLAFCHSHIPIPGQESKDFSNVVMIERISKQSVVLPTKTRPKKIVFVGSDGVDYPFLFKGQEDLHLDERIMQLLHICNLMLAQKRSDWPPYSARNYSVTPLGSRSGLIQWVEGATPMFHVYRKWQLRQASRKATAQKGATEIERPSELFFKRLKAAFDSNNISPDALADRQKWPLSILKSVLEDLINETPRDLLSRELWLRAGSAYTWYRTTEQFARSTAVMSMLGSVLGLGDRHLDNVLVNLESGHIVHIDYNICFDKGRSLRVPETVPFRLTGNMVHALGPTQIEGSFRLSCEHVLTKLRAGKETLLTILDAFVYDPLVDWAAAHDHLVSSATVGVATTLAVYGTDARAEAAHPLARALFAVRIKEMHMAWLENRERLYNALTRVTDILEKMHKYREGQHEFGVPLKGRIDGGEGAFEGERVEAGRELKQAITLHHDMLHDIRPLLRSLAHIDDRFRTYVRFYKESFSEPLIKGHKLLDDARVDFSLCIRHFRSVLESIHQVYDELLLLDKGEGTLLSPCAESLPVPPPGFEGATPHFKQQQEQNAQAKNVSRKVRQKLEGRDFVLMSSNDEENTIPFDANAVRKPMTPIEQADALIREATSLSNLALMYEGWTAWV